MTDKVLDFIKKFQNEGTIETFTKGCCYWFAKILYERFDDSIVMYNPILNHFATKVDDTIYDITGVILDTKNWISWSKHIQNDPLDARRVVDDCILKVDRKICKVP